MIGQNAETAGPPAEAGKPLGAKRKGKVETLPAYDRTERGRRGKLGPIGSDPNRSLQYSRSPALESQGSRGPDGTDHH